MMKMIYNNPITEVVTLDAKDRIMQSYPASMNTENPNANPFGAPGRIWRD